MIGKSIWECDLWFFFSCIIEQQCLKHFYCGSLLLYIRWKHTNINVQQWCFFFHCCLASSITNWVQIFTGWLFYVGIHQVRRLVFDNLSKVSSAFKDQSLIALIHAWAEPHHAVKYVTSGLTLWNLITFISPFELAYKCTTTLWIWMPQPSCEFTSSNSRGKISQGVYNITPTHLIDLHLVRIDPDSNCQEGLTFFLGSGWPGDWLEIRF